jgi:hypothetical protein
VCAGCLPVAAFLEFPAAEGAGFGRGHLVGQHVAAPEVHDIVPAPGFVFLGQRQDNLRGQGARSGVEGGSGFRRGAGDQGLGVGEDGGAAQRGGVEGNVDGLGRGGGGEDGRQQAGEGAAGHG